MWCEQIFLSVCRTIFHVSPPLGGHWGTFLPLHVDAVRRSKEPSNRYHINGSNMVENPDKGEFLLLCAERERNEEKSVNGRTRIDGTFSEEN